MTADAIFSGYVGLIRQPATPAFHMTFNPPPIEYWIQKLSQHRLHTFIEALPTLTPNPSPCPSPGNLSVSSWTHIRSATQTPEY